MKFLERCLLETLRLYPPVPIIARKLQEDVKLGNTNTRINSVYNKFCSLIAPIIKSTVFLGYDSVLIDSYRLFKGNCCIYFQGSTRTVSFMARLPSCLSCPFPIRRNHFSTQPTLSHDWEYEVVRHTILTDIRVTQVDGRISTFCQPVPTEKKI
jgi:hypothetical protein